ncbi:protein tag 52 [Trichuris trichiura]|uniref:Protein tag 52 n=1 Tax=Trichuris trichiura TaxID=36087 RepID=A0A077Z1G5_TRITR|nr:protein tag 52 [Trichuris trichiura]
MATVAMTEMAMLENVYEEIRVSERSYLEHLDMILRYFADPLLCSHLIPVRDVTIIFGDIRSIRLVNQVLYDRLNLGLDIVEAFGDLIHFMKLYTAYSRSYPASQQLLANLRSSNKDFKRFCEHQECLPALKGLKLSALLITPVQRIPRYKLLLGQMLNVLNENSKQYRLVAKLLEQISRLAETVNDCIAEVENSAKIIAVQKLLDSCAPKLLVPGRRLLKEGMLDKMAQKNSTFRRRMFWLFTDILLYAKPLSAGRRGHYRCSCVFPLRHCVVERVLGQSMFRLICKDDVVIMRADQYSVMDEWVFAIERAIAQLMECRRSLRKESSSSIPLHRPELRLQRHRSTFTTKLNAKRKECDVSTENREPERRNLFASLFAKLSRKLSSQQHSMDFDDVVRGKLTTSVSLFSTEGRLPLDKIAEETSSLDVSNG